MRILGKSKTTCYGIYLGDRTALWDDIRVMPVIDLLKELWGGEILQ